MTGAPRLQDLRRETRAAVERHALESREAASRRGRPAAPGDIFLSPGDPASPFEWAILERSGDAVRVVPADTHPAAGSRDVTVAAQAAGGPLVLRCGLASWLPGTQFDGAERSAILTPDDVLRALGRCREIELLGEAAAPAEADADPEYRDWVAAAAEEARRLPTAHRPASGAPPANRQWVAAAALLVAATGAGLGIGWLGGQAAGKGTRAEAPETNVPFVWLVPQERLRGDGTTAAPAGQPLVVILEVPALASAREHRLRVFDDGGRELLSLGGLRRTGLAELSLRLPAGRLTPGDYHLRVEDSTADPGAAPLAEYRLRLEAPSGSPGSP